MSFRRFFGKKVFTAAFVFAIFLRLVPAFAEAGAEGGTPDGDKFNSKEVTFHHLLDNYEWEFFKKDDGTPVKVDLPRILWNKDAGKLDVFGSTAAAEAAGYVQAHEYMESAKHGDLVLPSAKEELESLKAQLATASPAQKAGIEKQMDEVISAKTPLDFSFTKNVLFECIAAIILIILCTSAAKAYSRRKDQAPKGLQSFLEPVIMFVRDDIARENIPGKKYERYMPLLLTMFFFILVLNLLGMVPFSANVSGNISFTLSLALVSLIVTTLSGNKSYWKHIFWPPVPHGVKIMMIPLEILSIFTKPFALTIRLFANITGGHVVAISLLSLVFILGKMGHAAGVGFGTGVFSTLFLVGISLLEIFVALLQAYVFTMLTALFIGQAVAEEEHH